MPIEVKATLPAIVNLGLPPIPNSAFDRHLFQMHEPIDSADDPWTSRLAFTNVAIEDLVLAGGHLTKISQGTQRMRICLFRIPFLVILFGPFWRSPKKDAHLTEIVVGLPCEINMFLSGGN